MAPAVSFREALFAGLAPDGGLYVPQVLPVLDPAVWTAARGAAMAEIGTAMLGPLIGDEISVAALKDLLTEAFDFPVPIVRLDERLSVVELFHGPTFAFKDVGARVLARLMSHFHEEGQAPLTVLVATSGDTGGAVAQAFHGVPRTRVVVLYPHGQVSAVQEAQFTTLGGNVTAVAVAGTFDDCQRLAKQAFGDAALRERAHLTSANSISLGRLLPQMVYYGFAAHACECRFFARHQRAERKLRQSRRGHHGDADGSADRPVSRRDQRQRHGAALSALRAGRAAAVGADAGQRHGRR